MTTTGPAASDGSSGDLGDGRSSGLDWVSGQSIPHPTGGYDFVQVFDTGLGGSEKHYFFRGLPHRDDGPAIEMFAGSTLVGEQWYVHGAERRPGGGPTRRERYENGDTEYEEWWENDGLHRLDGPAHRSFYNDGRVRRETYHVANHAYSYEMWKAIVEAIENGAPLEWAIAYAAGATDGA